MGNYLRHWTRAGVPQGDCLSPTLYSLYIASLALYLDAAPDVPGAAFGLALIKQLFFADDLSVPTPGPAHLQKALNRVCEWSAAFGMDVNCSVNKTEAMNFPATKPAAPLEPAICPTTGDKVRWVSSYIYLGAEKNLALDDKGTITRMYESSQKICCASTPLTASCEAHRYSTNLRSSGVTCSARRHTTEAL